MSIGRNIFESINNPYSSSSREYYNSLKKPVVFLSHKSEDKNYVEKIGKYIMSAGIDIYLDKYDPNLQCATYEGDAKKVTECIQNGIDNSDYILCITSKSTINSWGVPYEIGYGKNAKKKISTLIRKDVTYIPDYLQIEPIMKDISELNSFIKKITQNYCIPLSENYTINKSASTGQIQYASANHPLSSYLNVK